MYKVYAMIADGTEEVECLGVADVLRRAGVNTELVSVGGKTVTGSHGIVITADRTLDGTDLSVADMLFIPGGIPGTNVLAQCDKLIAAIGAALSDGKRVAAICAAPALVLGANGYLKGKKAVCFPGYEDKMLGAEVVRGARVVTDGNITTARGLGCALELGVELVRLIVGDKQADDIAAKIQMK